MIARYLITALLLLLSPVTLAGWQSSSTGMSGGINQPAVDPADANRLVAFQFSNFYGTDTGVLETLDGGITWTQRSFPGTPGSFESQIDPSQLDIYLFGGSTNRYRSSDAGRSWNYFSVAGDNLIIVPGALFAAENFSSGVSLKLRRSLDKGANWLQVGAGLPAEASIISIVASPTATQRLYALVETYDRTNGTVATYRLYVSTDRGDNWLVASGLPALNKVNPAVFFDANAPAAVYVNGPDRIHRSADNGSTWTSPASLVIPPASTFSSTLSYLISGQSANFTRQNGPLASLVAANGASLMSTPTGVLRTTDGGATWTSAGTGFMPLSSLTVDPQGAVYVNGGFRSDNAGLTWTALSAGLTGLGDALVLGTKVGSRIYAAPYQSLFASTDKGQTWNRVDWIGDQAGAYTRRIMVDPTQPQRLFVATWQGIYRSVDTGQTWLAAQQGLASLNCNDLTIDPAGVLYAECGGRAYRSANAAQSWTALALEPSANDISYIGVSPTNPAVLVVHNMSSGSDNPRKIWVSSDTGASWTSQAVQGYLGWQVVPHPTNPDVWLIPGANGTSQCGVWRSGNRGQTWSFVTAGFPAACALSPNNYTTRGMAFDRSNPNVVYVGMRTNSAGAAVYRSNDAGVTWQAAGNGAPTNSRSRAVAVDINDPTAIYVTTGSGVYVSHDQAGSWQALPLAGLPPDVTPNFTSLTTLPGQPGVLLGNPSSNTGIYRYTPSATATALAIHGPALVQEGSSSSYSASIVWSDGTRTEVNPQWSTSNPLVATMQPNGSMQAALVSADSTVQVNGSYGGLSASYPVTVLDTSTYITSAPSIVAGWNLLGNSVNSPLNVVATFGNVLNPIDNITNRVSTVWKWDSVNGKWLFFSPSLTPTALVTYAAANGFGVLSVIHPGEGFWINASSGFVMPPQTGDPVFISRNSLINGWNLLSSGSGKMPSAVNSDFSLSPPTQGVISNNFVSLWAWDTTLGKWFFYSPSLDALGPTKIKEYTDSNGFLDFVTRNRSLHPGSGFWINMATTNPTSTLTPLGQAKGMFSELRTTINAFANNNKTGFLNQQATRLHDEMANKVGPDLDRFSDYIKLAGKAADLFDDVNNGATTSYGVAPASNFGIEAITGIGNVAYRFVSINGISYGCYSNAFASTPSANGLTAAGCGPTGPYPYKGGNTFSPTGYSWTKPVVQVFETGDPNVLNYSAHLNQFTYTYSNNQTTFVALPNNFTGTLTRSFLADTGNPSAIALAGDLPPSASSGALKDTVAISFTRAIQDAANSVYRYNLTGTLTSIAPDNASMVAVSLDAGTHFDEVEDAGGTAAINGARGLTLIGTVQTAASKFTGTFTLGAFALDADGQMWVPTSMLLDGSFSDLSVGGAGTFLTGRLTASVNNWPIVHSGREESALNFVDTTLSFTGTVKATGRPDMRLVVGATTAGYGLNTLNVNYSYGTISVTGSGTLDTFNDANNSLTLTNQDGITVRFVPHQDAMIKKGTQSLGVIPYGSAIIYYTDGYFESL